MSVTPSLYELSSGVPLLGLPDKNKPTAYILLGFGVGAQYETPQQEGMFHFIEHLIFKGHDDISASQLAVEMSQMGAEMNAFTSSRRTGYLIDCLPEDIPEALTAFTDVIANCSFPEPDLSVERGVVIQEIKRSLDKPKDVAFNTLYRVAFPDQGLGQTTLGPIENIANGISRDDLVAFKSDLYTQANLRVSVAGDYDLDSVRNVLNRGLEDFPEGYVPELPQSTYVGGYQLVERSDEQVLFRLSFEAAAEEHSDRHAEQLLSIILGGDMSSRLFQEVREKRGFAYEVWANASQYNGTGLFTVGGGTDANHIGDAIKTITDELKRATTDITQAELDKAKKLLKVAILKAGDTSEYQAKFMEDAHRVHGRVMRIEDQLPAFDTVNLIDLKRAAERVFSGQPTYVAVGAVANSGIPTYDQVCNQLRF